MAVIPRPFGPASAVPGPTDDPKAALAHLLGVAPDDLAASHLGPSAGTVYSPEVNAQTAERSSLDEQKRNLETQARYPRTYVSGASPVDVARQEDDIKAQEDVAAKNKLLTDFFSPAQEQQRQETENSKLALARAPGQVTAQSALDVEREKSANALALQRGQADINRETFDRLSGGGASDQGMNPAGEREFKMSVNPKGQVSAAQVMPNAQQQNRQNMAVSGLKEVPVARKMIDQLDTMGALGPVQGRIGDVAVSSGLGDLSEMLHITPPGSQRFFNDFKNQLGNIRTNFTSAHLGARGAANQALLARMDSYLNPHQTPDALRGGLDAVERWLTQYANATNSAELDRADAEFGVAGGSYDRPTGAASGTTDLGPDFHMR